MLDPYKLISKIILDEVQCQNIINHYDNNLERIIQNEHRAVDIKEIDIMAIPGLYQAVISANEHLYKFDLNGFTECYFSKYSTSDHYNTLHLDAGPGEITRKLSFTLLLNDDFNGGDFVMLEEVIEKKKGKLIVFPSFLPHKVTEITSGNRYAIFGFLSGLRLK